MKANQLLLSTLEAKAARQILEGCIWRTAAEVAQAGGVEQAKLDEWVRSRKVFGLERDGRLLFASYLFGPDHQPLPGVPAVLEILDGYGPARLAAWFESTSSFLGGNRPRELIASNPELVIEAARDAIQSDRLAG
jgi:hypothetical protein